MSRSSWLRLFFQAPFTISSEVSCSFRIASSLLHRPPTSSVSWPIRGSTWRPPVEIAAVRDTVLPLCLRGGCVPSYSQICLVRLPTYEQANFTSTCKAQCFGEAQIFTVIVSSRAEVHPRLQRLDKSNVWMVTTIHQASQELFRRCQRVNAFSVPIGPFVRKLGSLLHWTTVFLEFHGTLSDLGCVDVLVSRSFIWNETLRNTRPG